jgi:hypothetical protein
MVQETNSLGGLCFMLRDFIWKSFEATGSIQSYLAYKEFDECIDECIEYKSQQLTKEQEPAVSNM